MTAMTALDAKNAFGQFLEAVQRGPVTVTKNGREVGAMFSRTDLEAMGRAYLCEPLSAAVAGGMPISDALLRQAEMNRRLDLAEEDVAAGRVQLMDDTYFDRLRDRLHGAAAQR